MGIVAAAANYFILLPLFEQFMPLEQLIATFREFIPFIHTKLDVVLYNAFPFNFLKGLVISSVTMLVYGAACNHQEQQSDHIRGNVGDQISEDTSNSYNEQQRQCQYFQYYLHRNNPFLLTILYIEK